MPDTTELIGYLASALIVLSLLMSSLVRLRLVNLVGSGVFTLYAVLIASVPVLLANVAILLINLYHLGRIWQARSGDAYFEVVEWPTEGVYLPRFLRFHARDIARFQPDFRGVRDDHTALVVLRDAVPVGAVLVREQDGTAHVDLDYVTPEHRDLRAASHVYHPEGLFHERGIDRLVATAATDTHRRYLERVGFRPQDGVLVREVTT